MDEEITTTPDSGSSPTVSTMPDLAGKSSSEIESSIGQMNQGGGEQPKEEAQQQQPAEQPQVPDKFKDKDGNVNIGNILSSYKQAEQKIGQYGNINHENEQLKAQLQQSQQVIDDIKAQQSQVQSEQEKPEYTDEETDMIQKDPKKYINQLLDQREKAGEQKTRDQRIRDYEMITAVGKARETLPEFKALEPQIEELANKEYVNQHPEAVPMLYNSVLGSMMPQIVDSAKKEAYSEGYEKAKAEMKLQVEGGGKDTTPVDMSLNREAIRGQSSAELEKYLPHAGDGSTRVYR